MSKIRAIIFDMDGVLIDAKEWHYEALNRALGLFGYNISRSDHLTTFDGLPTHRKLELLSIEQNLPRALHGFINRMKQLYTREIVDRSCKPVFSHEYALSKLREGGYKLAVASNSIRDTVELMMERSNLRAYLDLMLSNQDVTRAKPDPEMYVVAMRRLGVEPQEALIVEDNPHGIKAAQASGAHVMVVADVTGVTFGAITQRIRMAEREVK